MLEPDPQSSCETGVQPDEVVVRILASAPGEGTPYARLGQALVDHQGHRGWLATVFADRIWQLASRSNTSAGELLGRVMAHELGHLLLENPDHARRGLMRAVFTEQELRRAITLDWQVSAAEARQMRARVAARAQAAVRAHDVM